MKEKEKGKGRQGTINKRERERGGGGGLNRGFTVFIFNWIPTEALAAL